MGTSLGWIFTVALASLPTEAGSLDELFAVWNREHHQTNSLIVEFTLSTKHQVLNYVEESKGSFRLLRTLGGNVYGSYDHRSDSSHFSALLNGGKLYLLDHKKKRAWFVGPEEGDVRRFLEKHWLSLLTLVDRQRTEHEFHFMITKQDSWYTYLEMTPKRMERSGWFCRPFQKGQVVLMNKDRGNIPRNMPVRFWYRNASNDEVIYNISSWQMNPAKPPTLDEFTSPEKRVGWKVSSLSDLFK